MRRLTAGCFLPNEFIMRRFILAAIAAIIIVSMQGMTAKAQKWSLATNILDYANFLTINAEAGAAVHRNWNLTVQCRYNPFSFSTRSNSAGTLNNRKLSVAAGARYWPFFVYSGFYYGGKLQWCRYSHGGIFSTENIEGDAAGMGFNAGYSLMVSRHFNIEFGIGFWFGWTGYRKYSSTTCGKRTGSGDRMFIAPNDIQINLLYNF